MTNEELFQILWRIRRANHPDFWDEEVDLSKLRNMDD